MRNAIRTLLEETSTWAVVGLSPDPRRDSHRIAAMLQRRGKRVIPVNPHADEVLGERAYAALSELPDGTAVDVVASFAARPMRVPTSTRRSRSAYAASGYSSG